MHEHEIHHSVWNIFECLCFYVGSSITYDKSSLISHTLKTPTVQERKFEKRENINETKGLKSLKDKTD